MKRRIAVFMSIYPEFEFVGNEGHENIGQFKRISEWQDVEFKELAPSPEPALDHGAYDYE